MQAVCLKATRAQFAAAGAATCSVFFKIKTGVRFVWRGAGEGERTALLVSVISVGSTQVLMQMARVIMDVALELVDAGILQVLDICEYSVQREPEEGGAIDDVALPCEGISECEITVINQTEMIFETYGVNSGCVYQTRYFLCLTLCRDKTLNLDINSFPPMTLTPLQLTDYRCSFSFELAARVIGGLFGGEPVVFQVHVADPFNSNTW